MTKETFVQAVRIAVAESSASGVVEELKKPIGRKPSSESIKRSEWFNRLSISDQQMVVEAVNLSANRATFGFFAVLDNVRSIESQGVKGDLELAFVKEGKRVILNDSAQEDLHDIFNRS